MDREAWRPTVHGVTKSWTRLGDLITGDFQLGYFMEGSTFNLNIILYEELMLSNCGAREGLLRVPWTQGDQTSQS